MRLLLKRECSLKARTSSLLPQSTQTRPPRLSPLQAGDGGQGSQRIKKLVFLHPDGYVDLAGILETPKCRNHAHDTSHDKFLDKGFHG